MTENTIKQAGKVAKTIAIDDSIDIPHVISLNEYDVPLVVDKLAVEFIFNSTFISRNSILGKMKNMAGIMSFLEGWDLHYNYFKPQRVLQNRTPGEMAGIMYSYLMFQIKHKLYLSLHHKYWY